MGTGAQAGSTGAGQANATAFGAGTTANAAGATAVGSLSTASGTAAIAIGQNTQASGNFSVAIGGGDATPAVASGAGAVALGNNAQAIGFSSSALGTNSNAGGGEAVAIGSFSNASGQNAFAGGTSAQATGVDSVALGTSAQATGAGSIAIGQGAVATGSVAIGAAAQAGNGGTAVGDNSSATFANSAAYGQGAAATRADQQVFGTATNTYTMPGIGSAASRAAQTGPVYFATADANGNLALSEYGPSSIAALDSRVTSLEASVAGIGSQAAQNLREARGGTALALAAASLRYDDRPEKLSIAGGVGHFKGLTGLSFGVGYAASNSLRFNAAVSGVPQNGDVGFSVGASWTLN